MGVGFGGGGVSPLILHDTFTDTDNVLLTDHVIAPVNAPAATWATLRAGESDLKIASNAAIVTTSPSSSFVEVGEANVTIQANVNIASVGSGVNHLYYIYARVQNTSNMFMFMWGTVFGTRTMTIYEIIAGANTSRISITPTINVGDYALEVALAGNQVSFMVGADVLTWVSTLGQTATKHGFKINGDTGDKFLDYKITTRDATPIIQYYFGIIGDSISTNTTWPPAVYAGYKGGLCYGANHAATGASIMAQMDGQTTASASDNSDIIIIALGTNDNNAGDMTALQAKFESNIAALKISNPAATIYVMNVLPRWTDTGGGTVMDKSNIRAAIAAACTAQSVTCWDTFTTPWIVAADTSDGTHPTAAGYVKVKNKVLSLLP